MSNESEPHHDNKPAAASGLSAAAIKTKLESLWNGDVPLFQTFWIYYFIGVFIIKLLGVISGLQAFFGLLALLWAGFMVKPIMLSADRYGGEKLWQLAAKLAAIFITIGVLSDLFL